MKKDLDTNSDSVTCYLVKATELFCVSVSPSFKIKSQIPTFRVVKWLVPPLPPDSFQAGSIFGHMSVLPQCFFLHGPLSWMLQKLHSWTSSQFRDAALPDQLSPKGLLCLSLGKHLFLRSPEIFCVCVYLVPCLMVDFRECIENDQLPFSNSNLS